MAKLAIINIFNKILNQSNITTIKTTLKNKVIIYKTPKNRQKLAKLIKKLKISK